VGEESKSVVYRGGVYVAPSSSTSGSSPSASAASAAASSSSPTPSSEKYAQILRDVYGVQGYGRRFPSYEEKALYIKQVYGREYTPAEIEAAERAELTMQQTQQQPAAVQQAPPSVQSSGLSPQQQAQQITTQRITAEEKQRILAQGEISTPPPTLEFAPSISTEEKIRIMEHAGAPVPETMRIEAEQRQAVEQVGKAVLPYPVSQITNLADVPMVGETLVRGSAQVRYSFGRMGLAGYERERQALQEAGEKQPVDVVRGAAGVAATSAEAFTLGAGIGAISAGAGMAAVGPSAARVAGRNVLLGAAGAGIKLTAAEAAIEGGVVAAQKGIGAGAEHAKEIITSPSRYMENIVIGTGVSAIMQDVATSRAVRSLSTSPTKAGATMGAIGGGIFGGIYASRRGEPEKAPEYAVAGAVIGGALGGAAGLAEEKAGAKFRAGTIRTLEITEKGETKESIRGFELGLEVGKGEKKFYGAAITERGAYIGTGREMRGITFKSPPEARVISATSAAGAKIYTPSPEYMEAYKGASEVFHGGKMDTALAEEKVSEAARGDKSLLETIQKHGGVVGGSTIERAITTPQGKTLGEINPRFAKTAKDIDVVFYRASDWEGFSHTLTEKGYTISAERMGLDTSASLYVQKFSATMKGGPKLDISVISPSIGMPPLYSPFSGYYGAGTYERTPSGVSTYSAGQQVATKFTAIGMAQGGKIAPFEKGKEKYVVDVASMAAKNVQEAAERAKSLGGLSSSAVSRIISSAPSVAPSAPSAPSKGISPVSVSISKPSVSMPSVSVVSRPSISPVSISISPSRSPSPSRPSSPPSSSSSSSSSSTPSRPSSPSSISISPSPPSSPSISPKIVLPPPPKFEVPFVPPPIIPSLGGGGGAAKGGGGMKGINQKLANLLGGIKRTTAFKLPRSRARR